MQIKKKWKNKNMDSAKSYLHISINRLGTYLKLKERKMLIQSL